MATFPVEYFHLLTQQGLAVSIVSTSERLIKKLGVLITGSFVAHPTLQRTQKGLDLIAYLLSVHVFYLCRLICQPDLYSI